MTPLARPGRSGDRVRPVPPGRIAFLASPTPTGATRAAQRLVARYGDCAPEQAALIVSLGGDGFMLETLHRLLGHDVPVYGMNCGSVGFLMNPFSEDDLPGRLARGAGGGAAGPLRMHAMTATGTVEEALALNEVSLLRQLRQTAKMRISSRRPGAAAGADVRRGAGVHAGGLDGLQPVGARPDRAAVGEPVADDADQRVPPAALARRPVAEHGGGAVRDPRAGQAAGGGGGRLHRGARRDLGCGAARTGRSAAKVLFDPDQGLSERIIAEQFTV